MSRIPDEIVEQVFETADLLEIVQESVRLKRQGKSYRGPCPFHGGTHNNFSVDPKTNLFHCFVCHKSGSVFTWYMERFGMDYPSAVREVARRYGITVPEHVERVGPDPLEPLYQSCDVAQTWFATQLREAPAAEPARRYLSDRQFDLASASEIGLGYAPRGQEFIAAMKALGISDEALLESGLVRRRDDGTLYPFFRDRLLFPIHDLRGRVVAFSGRVLGTGEPKYLNSSESKIFHKGEQLYHMHQARSAIRKAGHTILVEGNFDVQRLVLAGIDWVVAPLGTGFTSAQAQLMKRYAPDVVILYDSDSAGLKATFKAGDILLAQGLRVRVATMPEGDDPDTVVQRGGAAAIEPLISDAIDILERMLQLIERKGWFGDAGKSREALDRLLPTVRATSDDVTRELYITRISERLGIPRATIAAEAANVSHRPSTIEHRPSSMDHRPPTIDHRSPTIDHRSPPSDVPSAGIERKLLRLLINRPDWLERARGEVSPDRFAVPAFRRIYEALVALADHAPVGDAATTLDAQALDAWSRLVVEGLPQDGFDSDREYVGAIEALEEMQLFPEIAADPDPGERIRRRQSLSQEGQSRFQSYLNSRRRRHQVSDESHRQGH